MNTSNSVSKKQVALGAVLCMWMVGCLGDCKSVVKEANPHLDPMPSKASTVGLTAQLDPLMDGQWQLTKLGLQNAWAQAQGSRLVKVAVIGSGVDYNHEDLSANILLNSKEAEKKKPGVENPSDDLDNDQNGYVDDVVGWDVVESDGFPYDRTGTGTAAAGVIGAVHNNGKGIRGVAPNISLVPIRYIATNGEANVPRLILALRYAIARKVDLIYLHLANVDFYDGVDSPVGKAEQLALSEVLGVLQASGTMVVASAGNTGTELGKSKSVVKTFSDFTNVTLVTSVDTADLRPFISNFGFEVVDTAAPGEEILTTLPGNEYKTESGTYLAAAHVAGAVALAMSQNNGKTGSKEIYQALLQERASDLIPTMQFETIGGNRLNVEKLLTYLRQ